MANDSEPLPRVQGEDWTRAQRVAWCKQRAAETPWEVRISSMIQDMELLGIPLSPDVAQLGLMEGIIGGEHGVQRWIDGIN